MTPSNLRPILLVEDSAKDVELTLAALDRLRLASPVVVTRDGAEALDYLYAHGRYDGRGGPDPSLVLLDVHMPRVDGLQVLARIKGDDRLRAIPVVMLTSSQDDADVSRSLQLGANAYVFKPLGFEEFLRTIRDLAALWHGHNQLPHARRA
jgi:CheY-like chemotaxis protein